MTDARVDQLCDAAKARIEAAVTALALDPPLPVVVAVDDDPDIDPDDVTPGTLFVFVWWSEYRGGESPSRGEATTLYTLCFLAIEKCPDAALVNGRVPTAWRRLRTAVFDAAVVDELTDERTPLAGTAVADTADEVVFDVDELVTKKVFWTRAFITFKEDSDVPEG